MEKQMIKMISDAGHMMSLYLLHNVFIDVTFAEILTIIILLVVNIFSN